jgi:glycerol-3-phosphate acyltransferase PlsY
MCLDAAKGAVAVLVAQRLTNGPATPVAAGMAAVIGHIYPPWLRFRGGKGVATAAGVFLVLAPVAVAIASAVLRAGGVRHPLHLGGSLASAITLAVVASAPDPGAPVAVGAIITALIILHRHRTNLARLLAGTERRVGERLS